VNFKSKVKPLFAVLFALSFELGYAFEEVWFLSPKQIAKQNKSQLANPFNETLGEGSFSSILSELITNKDSTSLYRVESKVATLENYQNFSTSGFIEKINSILGLAPLQLRNGEGFLTITEQRKLLTQKNTGEAFRNVKIRTRTYMSPKPAHHPKAKGKNKNYPWLYSPQNFVRLFDHGEDQIAVRLEFKIDAVDSETSTLLDGVVEKPVIFCTKEDADILLDAKSTQAEIADTAERIRSYALDGKLVNDSVQVSSFLSTIEYVKKQQISISQPHEASIYKRVAYTGPNGIQITIDQDIRYIDFAAGALAHDFSDASRVVELKVPTQIMNIILDMHARFAGNYEALSTMPYYHEYQIWREFEAIPTAPGTKRNSGKTTRGKKAIKAKSETLFSRCKRFLSAIRP
jgi:hypothetical protein